jgi:hypothetical protein
LLIRLPLLLPTIAVLSHITHMVAEVLRARTVAIGCGYPDGNDFDRLRFDPAGDRCGRQSGG